MRTVLKPLGRFITKHYVKTKNLLKTKLVIETK